MWSLAMRRDKAILQTSPKYGWRVWRVLALVLAGINLGLATMALLSDEPATGWTSVSMVCMLAALAIAISGQPKSRRVVAVASRSEVSGGVLLLVTDHLNEAHEIVTDATTADQVSGALSKARMSPR